MTQLETLAVEFVLLVGYIIVVVIINKNLKAQIRTQGEIISNMGQYMNIIKMDEIQKYVEMSQKNVAMEYKDKLKEQDAEWKKKADLGITIILKEFLALLKFSVLVAFNFSSIPKYKELLNDMEASTTKEELLLVEKRIEEETKAILKNHNPALLALLATDPRFTGGREVKKAPGE